MKTTTKIITDDDMNSFLTEYEKERNARVMRNERLMQSLGLSSFDVHMHAFKKGGGEKENDEKKKKRKRKAEQEEMVRKTKNTTTNNNKSVAVRSSSRLRGEKATTTTTTRILNDDDNEEEELMIDEEIERKHLIAEKAFLSLRNKSKQKKQTIVGTASYQHTLMRVRTMTEPKLRNRMKAISRAKGQHCVTKMRLFARILFLEGYEELAEECAEELKELIEILGDAKDDETREVEEEQEQDGEDFDGDDNKENEGEDEEEKHSFHCGQMTNLDDPQIFKLVVEIESQARTNEKKEGEKDEDVYHRACVSMSKGKTGMLNKTAAFVLNEDGTYDVIKASEKELNALKTKKKTTQVMYF